VNASEVHSRLDLADFLDDLSRRAKEFPTMALERGMVEFLESASGWVADMDGYFQNRGEPTPAEPTWGLVASIFAAAAVYE
jgi:hypothetical protein